MNTDYHKISLKVRDYECDLQGIVNNSVYQNYLEHARHEMLIEKGINFADLAKNGINLVMIKIEINYISFLKPGDCFDIYTKIYKISKLRFGFEQIIKIKDKEITRAYITATSITLDSKPCIPESLNNIIKI